MRVRETVDELLNAKEGEHYQFSWKYNLIGGATSEILEDGELKNTIQDLAFRAAQGLNMVFASIDIIHTTDDELFLMEVNSNVYMEKFLGQDSERYAIVKSIYSKAIDTIFT